MKEWIVRIALTGVALLAPIHSMVATALALIVLDLVTGVWAAKKRNEHINSEGLRRSITKLLVYEAAIILAYIVEVNMLDGALPLSKMASGLIGTTELLSVLENLNSISGANLLRTLIDKITIEKK